MHFLTRLVNFFTGNKTEYPYEPKAKKDGFYTTEPNYACIATTITSLRKHNNADRLQIANVFGNSIICGLETKMGDRVLYFPLECQLSEEFAAQNDLLRRKDENGKPAGGMFDNNRRVRCQTLRGEKSEGFIIPLGAIQYINGKPGAFDNIKDGASFNTIIERGIEWGICKKYVKPLTRKEQRQQVQLKRQKPRVSRLIDGQFRFHFDTLQLGRNSHLLNPTSLISISLKLHGTSFICANVLTKRKLSLWERLLKKVGFNIDDSVYDLVYSSRAVIRNKYLDDPKQSHDYYGGDLYGAVANEFRGKLYEGETVYGEAVGFTDTGKAIQSCYDYGCKPNDGPPFKLYVYRITNTASDGRVVELGWPQVVARAKELFQEAPETIFYGYAGDWTEGIVGGKDKEEVLRNWQDAFINQARVFVEGLGNSKLCRNKVPEEGICVRIEGLEPRTLKIKSFAFLKVESDNLDNPEVVDLEAEESEEESA